MNNIVLNLIGRVEEDKNYFIDVLFTIYELRKFHNIDVKLNIVGKIYNYAIYQTLATFIKSAKIDDLVNFTKESIPFEILKQKKTEYFLNFAVGSFVGYSSIEAIISGLCTIFYNVDLRYENDTSEYITFNFQKEDLKSLLIKLNNSEETVRNIIIAENKELQERFLLDEITAKKLLNVVNLW